MNRYERFWTATMIRGILALLVGSAIAVIPDMAMTLLLLPFALAISILGLAAYGIADSVIIFITSFIPSFKAARIALRFQAICGVFVGLLLFAIVYDHVQLHWFFYLIALQALFTAGLEFVIARHTSKRHGSRWNFAAAIVAMTCGVTYLIAALTAEVYLVSSSIAWLVYGYLGAFGLTECLMAARMLYFERRYTHLAHAGTQ